MPLKIAMLMLFLTLSLQCHATDDDLVLIGFSGPLSGTSQNYGQSLKNAVQLAIDEANQKTNLIEGRKVRFKLLAQDDRQDANMALSVARYLLLSPVVGVIGNTNTTNSMLTAPLFEAGNLAHISPATSGRDYTRMGHRSSFRTIGHDEDAVHRLTSLVLQELQAKRVAILNSQTGFGVGIGNLFQKALENKKQPVIMRESVSNYTSDFNAVLDNFNKAEPDVIFFAGNAEQAAMLVRSMKRKQVKARLITAMAGVAGTDFLALAGDASEGMLTLEYGLPPEKMPGWKKFQASYSKAYSGEINPFTVCAYDAVNVLIEAVRQANSTNRRAIIDKLHTIQYKGVSGPISFDKNGDLNAPVFTLYEAHQLKWHVRRLVQQQSGVD